MQADIQLSTHVLTTQNAHQVGALVTLTGVARSERPPINVSLVLDRSGSMAGAPLRAARRAAELFAGFLGVRDRLSVVAFDDQVQTVFGPATAGHPAAIAGIQNIESGGSTNLSGGWLMGQRHTRDGLLDGINRVVLLTDGQANAGIIDPVKLVGLTTDAAAQRVSTSCIGFGPSFNEDLLTAMAQGGRGNYWYVENHDQLAGIFSEEIEGLVSLVAQNIEIEIRPCSPRLAGVTLLQGYPVKHNDDGSWLVTLGDLYASSPLALGVLLHAEDVAELGPVHLADLVIRSDTVTETGIEQRTITQAVTANLDGQDHLDPIVEKTFLRYEVARARKTAVRQADDGDLDSAATTLREAAAKIGAMAPDDPALAEVRVDLEAEAVRCAEQRYEARDRKYNLALSMAESRGKDAYRDKMRRGK
ncbi:MAG: VWA domain-containing protein [Gemmatimonadota bacterium]